MESPRTLSTNQGTLPIQQIVGGIRQATQGYFEITGRDGDGGGWGVADTPYKRVRVVTTIDFYLR